jgi:hypothetical protein
MFILIYGDTLVYSIVRNRAYFLHIHVLAAISWTESHMVTLLYSYTDLYASLLCATVLSQLALPALPIRPFWGIFTSSTSVVPRHVHALSTWPSRCRHFIAIWQEVLGLMFSQREKRAEDCRPMGTPPNLLSHHPPPSRQQGTKSFPCCLWWELPA